VSGSGLLATGPLCSSEFWGSGVTPPPIILGTRY
jgi:hypothetical protein